MNQDKTLLTINEQQYVESLVEMGGVFFKPLSNQQIQDHWTEEMIQGFYELGNDFPEYAAEIYAVCVTDD